MDPLGAFHLGSENCIFLVPLRLSSGRNPYSLGRSLDLPDEPVVKELSEGFAEEGYRLSALMKKIILSEAFLSR